MSPSAKFWDKIADRYAKQPIADEAAYQKKLEITRSYFQPDMTLLEFGCGTGSTAIIHAPHVKQIHAIDISAKMLEIAQANAHDAQVTNIRFEQNTIEALNLPDATYDMVLGLSILHLLEDKEAAIAKVYKMLKPGGYFVSSTTCLADVMGWFKFIAPIGQFFGVFPRVKVFTTQNLEHSLTAANFQINSKWQPDIKQAIFIVAQKTR